MRVIVIVKADKNSEADVMAPPELLSAMVNYNEELAKAGVLVAGEGLRPSSQGVRVHFSGEDRFIMDGPFTETKELIAGLWIWEVESIQHAVDWVKRCPNPQLSPSDIEIRQLRTMDDFADISTPEIEQQSKRAWGDAEAKHGKYM